MKPITMSPLGRYDILTFGLQLSPIASEARCGHYDGLKIASST